MSDRLRRYENKHTPRVGDLVLTPGHHLRRVRRIEEFENGNGDEAAEVVFDEGRRSPVSACVLLDERELRRLLEEP